jgi:hypothetical protein
LKGVVRQDQPPVTLLSFSTSSSSSFIEPHAAGHHQQYMG